jgi:hypothetical protein
MPSSTLPRASFDGGWRLLGLWAGLLTGPLAWAALLQTNYVLGYVACEQRESWMLHLATGVALALVAAAALVSWRAAPGLGPDAHEAADPRAAALLRARFMAMGGLALCTFFAIVILATEIPVLLLHPCTP